MPRAQTQAFEITRQNPNKRRIATLREGSKTLYFGLKGCKNYAYRIRHKLLLRANALAFMFSVDLAFTEGPHLCTSREILYCVQLMQKNTGLFREGTDHAPLVNYPKVMKTCARAKDQCFLGPKGSCAWSLGLPKVLKQSAMGQ